MEQPRCNNVQTQEVHPRTHTNPLARFHAERQFFQRQGKAFPVPKNQTRPKTRSVSLDRPRRCSQNITSTGQTTSINDTATGIRARLFLVPMYFGSEENTQLQHHTEFTYR